MQITIPRRPALLLLEGVNDILVIATRVTAWFSRLTKRDACLLQADLAAAMSWKKEVWLCCEWEKRWGLFCKTMMKILLSLEHLTAGEWEQSSHEQLDESFKARISPLDTTLAKMWSNFEILWSRAVSLSSPIFAIFLFLHYSNHCSAVTDPWNLREGVKRCKQDEDDSRLRSMRTLMLYSTMTQMFTCIMC